MGLFAQDPSVVAAQKNQHRYVGWTREIGTRNVILLFALIVCGWYIIGRIQDHFLLRANWPALNAQAEGLTIIGTLDSRDDYDHNMYRVVTSNQTSRVELTDFGWNTIFDDRNGPMFAGGVGDIIKTVEDVDNDTAYRMLEPYLRAGIARTLGSTDWNRSVHQSTPITVDEVKGKSVTPIVTTLGELLSKYTKAEKTDEKQSPSNDVGQTDNGHSVDHGLPIPADSLIATSPIVLTGSSFTGASIEEHPATMFDGKTFTVTLDLSNEGRSRFFQWSSKHENENLVFVLQHQVVAAGRIKQRMDVSSWQIGPLHDEASAKSLVNFVNGLKR